MSEYLKTWQDFTRRTDRIKWLKEHRDWVESHQWGTGDRPLHYMWYKLLKDLPNNSVLCEIGVYKGQVISLWALIAKHLKKHFQVIAISPLDGTGDSYSGYPQIDYLEAIRIIHEQFDVPMPEILAGRSQEPEIYRHAPQLDLLYIDGSHDESDVRQDVANYKVKPGGLVIFDDASCGLDIPTDEDSSLWFRGLEGPSVVADDFARDHKEILTVGHNRVFQC